uniref:Uncharacterized protein n=1 Tax=Amphora coffeiformis TaxID=265554 RepID=A0A7S3L612_9STRA|mmetsp:Transcript_13374/g.25392  ORF Transcript_13374/g.25392 Transcript_13374/m.25392 type:complete len:564 (-) Transcript_13374:41-1732(-)
MKYLQRFNNGNKEPGERCRPRPIPFLIWAAVAASFPSAVQGQLNIQTCITRLIESDRNSDGVISSVEFANFMVRASPYAPSCPNLSKIGDFLEGGKYYATLETASCYCLEYDTDPNCCNEPSIRLAPPYPDTYLIQACNLFNVAMTDGCTPTASPTETPTLAPAANIESRPTLAPTMVPSTTPTKTPSADTTDGSELELPKFTEGDKDWVFDRPLPTWMIIALPIIGLAMIVCCVGCCLLTADYKRKKQQERELAAKGKTFESDNDNDSMCGYPEVLEETDFDDTERTMEEGQIKEQTRAAVAEKSSKKPEKNLPPAKSSPKRMSQFLDSLDLENAADGKNTAKRRAADGKTSSKPRSADGKTTSTSRSANGKTTPKLRSADSKSRVSEIVDAVVEEQGNAKGKKPRNPPPAKADSKGRMGKFFENSAPSSDASASSAEIYDDQEDDASAGTGTTESNSQIKWKLLHPTTLVSTGAVEVFPLPPAVTGYVTSSSCSSNQDSGESKEADDEDYVSEEEDSVSDVYVSDASSSASTDNYSQPQPDPDGVRLEDGRHYREQWSSGR